MITRVDCIYSRVDYRKQLATQAKMREELPRLREMLNDLKARGEFESHDGAPDNLAAAKARKVSSIGPQQW